MISAPCLLTEAFHGIEQSLGIGVAIEVRVTRNCASEFLWREDSPGSLALSVTTDYILSNTLKRDDYMAWQ